MLHLGAHISTDDYIIITPVLLYMSTHDKTSVFTHFRLLEAEFSIPGRETTGHEGEAIRVSNHDGKQAADVSYR